MKRLVLSLGLFACSGGAMQPKAPAPPPVALQRISLAPAEGFTSICFGAPFQLAVTGITADGRRLATPTSFQHGIAHYAEHGLPWERFQLTAAVGSVVGNAMYAPPASIFTLAETPSIAFHAVDRTDAHLTADVEVPVDFKCGPIFELRGAAGARGAGGQAGADGDPGGEGGIGGHVEIRLGHLQTRAHGSLILARIDSVLGRAFYLLQPGGAALVIDLSGGVGGYGGDSRPAYVQNGASWSGLPGAGGAGGRGGSALIRVDASDPLLVQAIRVYNGGGEGGQEGQGSRRTGLPGPDGMPGLTPTVTYEDARSLFADELAQGFPIALPQVAR